MLQEFDEITPECKALVHLLVHKLLSDSQLVLPAFPQTVLGGPDHLVALPSNGHGNLQEPLPVEVNGGNPLTNFAAVFRTCNQVHY